MNILIDKLPNKIDILGEEYNINSDFRVSILFELLMQDNSISNEDKITQALLLYYEEIPKDINKAIEKMLWFYSCGKEEEKGKGNNNRGTNNKQIYSFEYDANYIYSAFQSQYNIDLESIEYLHWWKFRALFNGLNKDNKIVEIMEIRSADLNKIKDKNEKEYYRKMKEIYKIPISKEESEKLDEIAQALLSGTFNQNLL